MFLMKLGSYNAVRMRNGKGVFKDTRERNLQLGNNASGRGSWSQAGFGISITDAILKQYWYGKEYIHMQYEITVFWNDYVVISQPNPRNLIGYIISPDPVCDL